MPSSQVSAHRTLGGDRSSGLQRVYQGSQWTLRRILLVLLAIALLVTAACYAAPAPQGSSSGSTAIDPQAIVRRASQNELRPEGGGHPFRFRLHKVDDGKSSTKEIIETKEGDIARLVEKDGKPLDADANHDELDRLNNLLEHPEIQERRHKKEQEDSSREDEMVRLLPDAFLYQFVGMAEGPNGPCYRLAFKPNPSFNPPDRQAEVYHGMAGEFWVDKQQERMVKLDAHLIADVNFGWGILGKLYKGGSILVEQTDVGDHHWETTHMKLNLQGKALMLKSLNFQTVEDGSDFHPVPASWGYKDAVKQLESSGKG